MKKYISFLTIFLFCAFSMEAQTDSIMIGKKFNRKMTQSPKIIVCQEKMWFYNQKNELNRTEMQSYFTNPKDTVSLQYDGLFFMVVNNPFYNTTVSWDVDPTNIYGVNGLSIEYKSGICYGAGGSVNKLAHSELGIWAKGTKRDSNFNYWQAFRNAFFGNLPLNTWFEKKYHQTFLYNWKRGLRDVPFTKIADSVIGNTYFDFFKLKSNDSTAFFALCEGNVLSTWHFTSYKEEKLKEYPFKPTGYFHVLEHRGQSYLISAEGIVFKIGPQLEKVQELPRPLNEGWLIVDKDHDKIYFLEQKYFSFADKPRSIKEILKNAFVVF
ncbi:MAG: hypothetical protein RL329_3976 [Bacteroidota bacterium]|jgi:hypothetical protein